MRLRILVVTAFVLAVIDVVRMLLPSNLVADARTILEAVLRGDGHTVYKYSFEEELRVADLSAEKLDRCYKRLILPRLSKLPNTGPIKSELMGGGAEGVAWVELSDTKGHRLEVTATAWLTEGGGKTKALAFLSAAWQAEYRVIAGKSATAINVIEASLEGVRQDKSKLTAMGITGLPSDDGHRLRPWDEVELGLVQRLAQHRTKVSR